MSFPCIDCGKIDTAPTETGRCLECCDIRFKEWKQEQTMRAIEATRKKKNISESKKVDKERKRQENLYGKALF